MYLSKFKIYIIWTQHIQFSYEFIIVKTFVRVKPSQKISEKAVNQSVSDGAKAKSQVPLAEPVA